MIAVAAPAGRIRWQGVIRAALTLSVALNLFFIAGAAWVRLHPPGPRPGVLLRLQQVEPELALNRQQRQAFDAYADQMQAGIRQMRGKVRPLVRAVWRAFAEPQVKADDVMRIFAEVRAQHRAFQEQMIRATLALFAQLSPAQRQKFVGLIQRARAARR